MITTYIQYLRYNRGLSENTLQAYEQALRKFARFIKQEYPDAKWSTIKKEQIDYFVSHEALEGANARSIKQYISALRTYYKTAQALGDLSENPARYVSTPKLAYKLPHRLTAEEVMATLEDENVNADAKGAIAIIFETGIRLQELLDLKAEHIDNKTNSILIKGKGDKERTVYYSELTKKYGSGWHVGKYTQREVRAMVFSALSRHSNANKLSPHVLRHTYASELVNNGMPLQVISTLLGHKSTRTTEIYTHLSNSTTAELYKQYRPTARRDG